MTKNLEITLYEFHPPEAIPVLIVSKPTGIEYVSQSGGTACRQTAYEGFIVPFMDIAPNLNDCELGCENINIMNRELQLSAAKVIEQAISDFQNEWDFTWNIKFDFDRTDELLEDWWPVLFTGSFGQQKLFDHPCIYARQRNCD